MRIDKQKFMLRQLRKEWENLHVNDSWCGVEKEVDEKGVVSYLVKTENQSPPPFEDWLKEQEIEEDQ